MTEKAFELHAELGNAASEVSSLLADIDRKSKVEDRNRVLIQNFHAQLDQQLEVVHETVAASVTEQEQQLKHFRNIALEADPLINKLQNNLNNQEEKIDVFAQHQHEVHSRTLQMTRLISSTILNFFDSLSLDFSKLTLLMEEARTVNDQELYALEKKFKEYAVNEERQLLDKVAEMLATSTARKIKLVGSPINWQCI
ncbi:Kinesin-like protein KIN-5A [Camellia lanceoleosa]|uniref:Kinesin-like protein KIN-5A n=1 Tax=Camellia lanceoleosa TaxID=1840588 RepID=A0ACC0HMK6_9ERIC|nr:Kinesin-like protein KIN-5A [Camellia lanceoleosa]